MMVDWLAKYRLSADEEESSGEDASNYVGKVFSKDDLCIQSDLIDHKEIYSTRNPKFHEKVHPIANRRLVDEFDPIYNKADMLLLQEVREKKEPHENAFSLNRESGRLLLTEEGNQQKGDISYFGEHLL
jgi:hypothetical protein